MPDDRDDISIRINTAALEADAKKVEAIFIELFASIEKYSSKSVSPINLSGFTELNQTLKATNAEIVNITKSLGQLNASKEKVSVSTKNVAKATEEEDATLKLYKKTLEDIIALEAKDEVLDTEAIKRKAELTLKIKERQRAILEEVQANSVEYQQRMQMERLESDMKARLAEQTRSQIKADREYAKTRKEQSITNRELERQMKSEAKSAIDQSNAFDRLKQKVRELRNEYALLVQSAPGGAESPLAKAKLQELSDAQSQLNKLTEEFGQAGSQGLSKWGKGLTEIFSNIRQLAYILPGLGIAGIFNLAFEAIAEVVKSSGLFNDALEETIEKEGRLTDYLEKTNEILREQADLYKQTGSENVDYYRRMQQLTAASGVAAEQQFGDIENYNRARKEAADDYVDEIGATWKKVYKESGELKIINEQRQKIVDQLVSTEENLERVRKEKEFKPGVITGTPIGGIIAAHQLLSRAASISALEDLKETFGNELKLFDKQAKELGTSVNNMRGALEEQIAATTDIEGEALKKQRFFTDQARGIREAAAKEILETTKVYWEGLLRDKTSTQQEQLTAIWAIYKLEVDAAKRRDYEIQHNTALNGDQRAASAAELAVRLLTLQDNLNKDLRANQEGYEIRNMEARKQMANAELEVIVRTNDAIVQDTNRTLKERMNALGTSQAARLKQLENEYNDWKQLNDYVNKTKSEQNAADANYLKNVNEVLTGVPEKVRNVFESSGNKRIRQLKEERDSVSNSVDVNKQYAAALYEINQRLLEGSISYKEYSDARKKIDYGKGIAEADEQIAVFEERIIKDKDAIIEFDALVEESALKLLTTRRTGSKAEIQAADDAYKILISKRKETIALLEEDETKLEEARYRRQEIEIKAIDAGFKQVAQNWKEFWKDVFQFINELADASFERRIARVQEEIELLNKRYDAEIEAIGRSSIAEKDRTALTIQLTAQRERANEEAAKKERRLRHDQAIIEKALAMAKIIWDTTSAIMAAVKSLSGIPVIGPALAKAAAISYGALGAVLLARAAAAPIPALAEGTEDWEGGRALVGEAGEEWIKKPGKSAYKVNNAQVTYLPKGTQVIPVYDIPVIGERNTDDSWQQTKYLAGVIKKGNKTTTQKIVNNINIDLGWTEYKHKILYGNSSKV